MKVVLILGKAQHGYWNHVHAQLIHEIFTFAIETFKSISLRWQKFALKLRHWADSRSNRLWQKSHGEQWIELVFSYHKSPYMQIDL